MSPRSTDERIADIAQWAAAAREAEATLLRAETAFDRGVERVAFNAILYALLAIGEAVKALPDEVKAASPHINWVGITGMRDVLAHEYFRISASVVQDAVDQPLSELLAWCQLHGAEGPPASSW